MGTLHVHKIIIIMSYDRSVPTQWHGGAQLHSAIFSVTKYCLSLNIPIYFEMSCYRDKANQGH